MVLCPPQFYMVLLNTTSASLKYAGMSFVAYIFSFSIHLSAIILLHYYLAFHTLKYQVCQHEFLLVIFNHFFRTMMKLILLVAVR